MNLNLQEIGTRMLVVFPGGLAVFFFIWRKCHCFQIEQLERGLSVESVYENSFSSPMPNESVAVRVNEAFGGNHGNTVLTMC